MFIYVCVSDIYALSLLSYLAFLLAGSFTSLMMPIKTLTLLIEL